MENISKNIMLVEDSKTTALLEKHQLKNYGYNVNHVSTGEEAVDAVINNSFLIDLILMDIDLEPGIDGTQAAVHILSIKDIPIIFLSSHTEKNVVEMTEKITSYGYVVKESGIVILDASIKMAFKLHDAKIKHQEAEKAIIEQKNFSESLIETAQVIILVLDISGRIVRFNYYLEELTGYTLEDLRGNSWFDVFIQKEELDQIKSIFNANLNDNKTYRNINTIITKDGKYLNIEWRNKILKDKNGKTVGVLATGNDISAKSLMEAKLKKNITDVIKTMGKIVGLRDPYTAGHQNRVAKLSRAIAIKLELPKNRIENIFLSALIHDIGTIYIPSEILSKPSKLSSIEYALLKTHTQHGYDAICDIDFPDEIRQGVYQHHEKVDGSGYPNGLKGDEILLEARILCVADVVEAMASHRPYRPALGIDAALEEIIIHRGKYYDTSVVDACVELFRTESFSFE